jgi:papain like protease
MSSPEDKEALLQENAALKAKLDDYKKLEEDLIAKRVFEKARGYLTAWITLGGILLTLAGFVGYKSVIGYFQELGRKKIEAYSEEQIKTIFETSINVRVDQGVDRAMPQISERVFQRVTQRSEPLTGPGSTNSATLPTPAPPNKPSIDWTPDMAAPRNSGTEGSIVGHTLAATLEFYVFHSSKKTHVAISARDIYNETRAKAGTLDTDSGVVIAEALEFLKNTGAVEERAWPYRSGDYKIPPPPSLANEKRYKIADIKKIVTLEELKNALQSGPVITGVQAYESLWSEAVATTGVISMPKPKERRDVGLSFSVVGYDDAKKLLKFQHSWGTEWGDRGYGYLPYDYFREQSYDCFAFHYADN